MSAWRRTALQTLPELRAAIDQAATPMALWFELLAEFKAAFHRDDEQQLARILAFARWCWASNSHPVSNAVACGFYEHLPEHDAMRAAIPRLFRQQEFDQIRSALAIHVGEAALDEVARAYRRGHK